MNAKIKELRGWKNAFNEWTDEIKEWMQKWIS